MHCSSVSERRWELAGFLAGTSAASSLGDTEWGDLLVALGAQGVLPWFAEATLHSSGEPSLTAPRRGRLEGVLLRAKAKTTVLLEELRKVLGLLEGGGLRPVLLKGCDLALRVYPEAHLRPMEDLDLLFEDRGAAEKAYEILLESGYESREVLPGGSPWYWSQHLPVLRGPEGRCLVEVHAGLLYPPFDARSAGTAALGRETESWDWEGLEVHGLRPEANVIYLFAHAIEQHPGEAPKLGQFLDVRLLLEKRGRAFDWDKLCDLAEAAGLLKPTALGLRALGRLFGTEVPEATRERLGFAGLGEEAEGTVFEPATFRTSWALRGFTHARPRAVGLAKAFHLLLPTRSYMRFRHPQWARSPLPLCYLLRWGAQIKSLLLPARGES